MDLTRREFIKSSAAAATATAAGIQLPAGALAAAGGGGACTGGDVLLPFLPRLAQMAVHVEEARRDPGPRRVDDLGARLADGTGTPGETLDERLTIACGTGAVQITRLQKAGSRAQDAEEFLRGATVPRGTRLN